VMASLVQAKDAVTMAPQGRPLPSPACLLAYPAGPGVLAGLKLLTLDGVAMYRPGSRHVLIEDRGASHGLQAEAWARLA
jgi:hypothetical protein